MTCTYIYITKYSLVLLSIVAECELLQERHCAHVTKHHVHIQDDKIQTSTGKKDMYKSNFQLYSDYQRGSYRISSGVEGEVFFMYMACMTYMGGLEAHRGNMGDY